MLLSLTTSLDILCKLLLFGTEESNLKENFLFAWCFDLTVSISSATC